MRFENIKLIKFIKYGLVFVLLVLNFLALDDITTGNEPALVGEWAIVFGSVVLFVGGAFIKVFREIKGGKAHKETIPQSGLNKQVDKTPQEDKNK